MVNQARLFRRLKRSLGSEIFNSFSNQDFMEILEDETLVTFSNYYPHYLRAIKLEAKDGIKTYDQNGRRFYSHYRIPNLEEREIIGIEYMQHPLNEMRADGYGYAVSNMIVHTMAQQISSMYPRTAIAFHFEAPDILVLRPPARVHYDFVVTAAAVRKLHEVPGYYEEPFTRLFIMDVKSYIYNEFRTIRDESNLNGTPISLKIDDFSSAEDDRRTLLEEFDEDYYRDPEKIETMMIEAE